MLESANQQNAHTTSTTASPYKKQKRSDPFYGRIKRRVPLQDVRSSKKSRLVYYKEKKTVQRSKESLEDKEIRLRQVREYARMRRSKENESPAHREAHLEDQKQRSQQQCANETEAQREARLEDRSQQLCANESEPQ